MRYGIRWEDHCVKELLEIYGTQEMIEDATSSAVEALARAPLHRETWPVAPGSDYRLATVKPFLHFPAVALSYTIVIERDPSNQYCLMHNARRA
jgi:hypothetical protein